MEHFYQNLHGWFDFQNLYTEAVNHFPNGSRFAEIGVWQGKSLAYMVVEALNNNKKIIIDAVDTWEGSPVHKDKNHSSYESITETEGALYKQFLENIEPIKQYVNVHKKPSMEAVKEFSDNTFDFIFIDADHEMPHVLNDIEGWYPKLKKGGWYAGHDATYWPVSQALDIFCNKHQFTRQIIGSSWIIKT